MRGGTQGFVLVATLWALAVLALLAAYVTEVTSADVARALDERQRWRAELERRSTEATVIYLLATNRMNHRAALLADAQRFPGSDGAAARLPAAGEAELRVTGTAYAGVGAARFSVQDEGGLVSVNAPRFPLFATVLRSAGIAAADVRTIVARVEDYIDVDDRPGPDGAEGPDYRQHGRPPPPNWIMASPLELSMVLGVDERIDAAQWRRLRPLLTVRPVNGYNFNTMHPEILAALLDLDGGRNERVLDERARTPLTRLRQIAMLSGKHLDIDELEVAMLPSRFQRIALWHEGPGPRVVVGVELTPLGERTPWRIDYRYPVPPPAPGGPEAPGDSPREAPSDLLR